MRLRTTGTLVAVGITQSRANCSSGVSAIARRESISTRRTTAWSTGRRSRLYSCERSATANSAKTHASSMPRFMPRRDRRVDVPASPAKKTRPAAMAASMRWEMWKFDSQSGGPACSASTNCASGWGCLAMTARSARRRGLAAVVDYTDQEQQLAAGKKTWA